MNDFFRVGKTLGGMQHRVDTDKHSSQTDEAVKGGHKLWHADHLDALRHNGTNYGTDRDHCR